MENDRLPLSEDSVESQNKFKDLKDQSLYAPIVLTKNQGENNALSAPSTPTGRPTGTKSKQSTKKISPIGIKGYSLATLTETMKLAENLYLEIEKQFLKNNKVKKLNEKQKELIDLFAAVIMRIREPKTTSLIFASGKLVVTGAKSEEESRLAARK